MAKTKARNLRIQVDCDTLVDAIEELIDEKIRDENGKNPYWAGQAYEARKRVRSALLELMGVSE